MAREVRSRRNILSERELATYTKLVCTFFRSPKFFLTFIGRLGFERFNQAIDCRSVRFDDFDFVCLHGHFVVLNIRSGLVHISFATSGDPKDWVTRNIGK